MTVNMLGSHHVSRPSRTVAEWLWPFLPMGVAAFSLSALVYYHLRQNVFEVHSPLQQLYAGLYSTVGFAPAVMFFGLVLVWSTIWLVVGQIERPASRLFRLAAMAVMLGVFLNLGDGGVSPALHKGAIGAWFAETLVGAFGYWPSLLLVWAITFASLLLATDFFFHESFERLRREPERSDAGVEAAVTEHLRGLGEAAPAPRANSESPTAGSPTAAVDLLASASAANDVQGSTLEESPAPRRSYAERRAEREARSWRRPADEEWVPAAPESQEIDDPESRSQRRVPDAAFETAPDVESDAESDAEPAPDERAAGTDEPAVAGDEGRADAELPASLESPEAIREDVDDLAAASAAPAAPAGAEDAEDAEEAEEAEPLPRPRLEPIVFPDEQSADLAFASEVALPEVEAPNEPPSPPWIEATPDEPTVSIPRPEPQPQQEPPAFEREEPAAAEPSARQQRLFGADLDEGLIQDAIEVVTGSRRASVAFLQRKLRIDYALATEVLAELAARGVVALDGDATQGRVLG